MLDRRTDDQLRHAQDVAQLLSAVPGPLAAWEALLPGEIDVLRSCAARLATRSAEIEIPVTGGPFAASTADSWSS